MHAPGQWRTLNDEFRTRLAEERRRLGLKQAEFAALVGANVPKQSRHENDKRELRAAYLARLAEAGVDIVYALTDQRSEGGKARPGGERPADILPRAPGRDAAGAGGAGPGAAVEFAPAVAVTVAVPASSAAEFASAAPARRRCDELRGSGTDRILFVANNRLFQVKIKVAKDLFGMPGFAAGVGRYAQFFRLIHQLPQLLGRLGFLDCRCRAAGLERRLTARNFSGNRVGEIDINASLLAVPIGALGIQVNVITIVGCAG